MRMMMKLEWETEAANQTIREGKMPGLLQDTMERLKPEAVYFAPLDGRRTVFAFFDLKDPSDLPAISEPLFQAGNANIRLVPAMNLDDLMAGLQKAGIAG
jgi:hypothetical protein